MQGDGDDGVHVLLNTRREKTARIMVLTLDRFPAQVALGSGCGARAGWDVHTWADERETLKMSCLASAPPEGPGWRAPCPYSRFDEHVFVEGLQDVVLLTGSRRFCSAGGCSGFCRT